MISKVSFGSTYKVSNQNNTPENFSSFQTCILNYVDNETSQVKLEDKAEEKYPYNYSATYTVVVPNSKDNEVEAMCAALGINFIKLTDELTTRLLDPKRISSRIEKPGKGTALVAKVNVKRLEELIKNQQSNLVHCESDYNKYFKNEVDFMLKSGNKFPATTLCISPNGASLEDTLEYIEKYGANRLNDDQLSFYFDKRTNDPDHCVYFALRNLGMEEIPVYVSFDSYKLGSVLGLFTV